MEEKLDYLKILLDIKDDTQDEKLNLLLRLSENNILAYTGRKSWIDALDGIHLQITMLDYNRLGKENITSHTVGEVSIDYDSEYPANILNILNKYRVARVVGIDKKQAKRDDDIQAN